MTLCPTCGQPMPNDNSNQMAQNFAIFWDEYPHKVGKAAAVKAYMRALRRDSDLQILGGLRRYKQCKPPSTPWCNPATWLNQERWLDQPDYIDPADKPKSGDLKGDGYEIWRTRIRAYLKDGCWPPLAPPLAHAPPRVLHEFNLDLEAHQRGS